MQKQCIQRCKECSYHTPDSEEDVEKDFCLQGTISRPDIEYKPLCHTLQFRKLEKAACKNDSCPSKQRQPKSDEDHRPEHEFFYGLRVAPPILVIHCKPFTTGQLSSDGRWESYLSGKVTRLEHSLAISVYPDRSLDPNTINWAFYHLYGVVLREGDTGSAGHYVCAFEQRQTGRWLFFNDTEYTGRKNDKGQPLFEEVTYSMTRSQLDDGVDKMQKGDWRIFMLMYRKLFQVPIRLLTRITFPSTAIALQDQQSHEESGERELERETEEVEGPEMGEAGQLEMEEAGRPEIGEAREPETEAPGGPEMEEPGEPETGESWEPETEAAQEEYFTPGESVGDEGSLGSESDSGQTRGGTHGAAGDEELQGGPSDSETRNFQAEQSMPKELPAVETDPESSASESATEQTQGAADNVSQRGASDLEIQPGQAEQLLLADLPTEQGVEVEADPESSTATPDTTKTGSRAQAGDEDEQMTSSQPASEIVRTEVEPPAEPKKKQAKGKGAKRTREDENDETSTSVPASKNSRTGAKSSTQPKKKEAKSKATNRTQKDASDDPEDEKAEISAPPTKRPKTVVDLSTAYGGRETRARAAAKRFDNQIPDVDKIQSEQTATAKTASKKAKSTEASAQTGKTEPRSKAGRKK